MSRRSRPPASQSGFTIIELLVATAIMLAVLASLFSILNPAEGTFQAQQEVSDLQQRMRVAVDTLSKDLMMAGAGVYSGLRARSVGALSNVSAPILPYRAGGLDPDPPGTFKADTISLLYVPDTAAQTTISSPLPPTSNHLEVNNEPGCPFNHPLCGFQAGMQVIIFDNTGSMDTFVITGVQESAGYLQRHGPDFTHSYDAGSVIAQVSTRTYYLKNDDVAQTYELRYYDGNQTDVPLVDNVVGLIFEYYGDPRPPTLRKPTTDPTGPWTTYGPKPPAPGVDSGMGYGAGENCVFAVSNGQQVPRLPDLSPGSSTLQRLTQAALTDGPWCPGPNSAARYDADLLRIRAIRVTVRVQANLKMLRGTGALFAKGGNARGGDMYVPDQELRFDVAPRNLNLGR
jgi:prepilin-type N-terminal cleavage/methylation domain-containing protein